MVCILAENIPNFILYHKFADFANLSLMAELSFVISVNSKTVERR